MKEKGQSLTEMAIMIPVLLLMLLGLLEVGWMIVNYLTLFNQTREVARFGVRTDVAEFTLSGDYVPMLNHFEHISQQQPNFDARFVADPNASLHINRFDVAVSGECGGSVGGMVLGATELTTYTVTFGVARPPIGLIGNSDYYNALIDEQARAMCDKIARGDTINMETPHSVLRVDAWYQPLQLVRFFGTVAPTLHTHATMRLR